MDPSGGPARGLRDRRDRYPGRHLRRGPAAAIPGQRARHAQPGRHPDEPALQRHRHPGRPVPVPSAAPDRRPPGPAAHRRDRARRHRRIGHPRRTDPRPEDLRSGRIRRPAPARGVAHRHQADPASRPRPPAASHSFPGPDRAGLPGRLRRRHLRHRRWLNPGPPASPSASGAWPAATSEPASRPVCPTLSSGGSSASSSSPSAPGTCGPG